MKRRTLLMGTGVAAIAAAAGLYRFTDTFVKHYPPTPYDDMLDQLADRAPARRLGKLVQTDTAQAATRLRRALEGQNLRRAVQADITSGRLVEVAGWQLPQSVADIAVIAARS